MAGDDLPLYPTPLQQYNKTHPLQPKAQKLRPAPLAQTIYRPPTHIQPSASHLPQNSYRPPPQQHASYTSYLSTPPAPPHPPQQQQQQQYYQQAAPPQPSQPPPQQYYQQSAQAPPQQHQTAPPQSQHHPAPSLQQYYQQAPSQHPQQQAQQHQPQQGHYQQQSGPKTPQLQHFQHTSQPTSAHLQNQHQQQPQQYSPVHSHSQVSQSQPPNPPHQSSSSRKASKAHDVEYPSSQQLTAKQILENELRAVFEKVDVNRSGKISSRELSTALLNFDHTRFQDSTISLMVNLFCSPESAQKSLDFDQFVSLWKYLSAYKKLFIAADSDKLGDISFGEFQKILEQIGYKLNIDLVLHLFQKFSNKGPSGFDSHSMTVGKLKFDAFIELLVTLRKFTDVFKKYDKGVTGIATIKFLDFLFEVVNLT